MPPLHPNWAFVLDRAAAFAPNGKILDYGCGQGVVVAVGLERGLDIWGADVFYGGGQGIAVVVRPDLLGKRIHEIRAGRIPFDDGSFDFVFHNQVFEHVPDLDVALKEIRRVLKPDGLMLSLFPSRDVLREGHCEVPLAHRFRRGSKLRYFWLLSARKMGFGTFHGQKSHGQWARDFAKWLEDWCYYRSRKEVIEAYSRWGFSFDSYETEYAAFRLDYTGRAWAVRAATALSGVTQLAIRKLAGMVVLSRVSDSRR